MKILVLLTALFTASIAQASPGQREIVLPKVEINGEQSDLVAVLHVNQALRTLTIDLFHDICHSYTALPGQITCMAMPSKKETLTANIVNESQSCGSKILTARSDDRIRDGIQTEIEFTDHSQRLCEDVIESAYIVEASTYNPWTQQKTTYRFKK